MVIKTIGRQLRLARNAVGIVAGAPQLLLYPIAFLIVTFGASIPVFVANVVHPLAWLVAFVLYLTVIPIMGAFFIVAYCYELNELFEGQEPGVGSGVGVAFGRLRLVALASLVFGTGGFFLRYLGVLSRFLAGPGTLGSVGVETVSTFVYPVVALADEDQTAREAFEELKTAVEREFRTAAFAAVGIRALVSIIFLSGFAAAVAVLAVWSARGLVPGPGVIGLALVLFTGATLTAVIVGFLVSGLVKTALYRYAIDGELPPELGVGVEELILERSSLDDLDGSGPLAWLSLGRQQATEALGSVSVWALSLSTAIFVGIVAVLFSTVYTEILEGAISTVENTDASLEEVAQEDELEALELVFGPDPTREDILTVLESIQGSGDVLGVVVLSGVILSLGPLIGLLVTVPSIVRRRRDGSYERLLEAGFRPRDVVVGTFIGRLTAASLVVVLPAISVAAVVWRQQAAVGVPYIGATVFAVGCVGIFVALGTFVGTAARGLKTAIAGSLGVWVLPYAFSGNPVGVTGNPGRDGILEAVLAPPWDFLPAILTRFNLYNVITDGMHLATLSSVVDSLPRISRVSLSPALTHEAPPQEAVAELPIYLHQFVVYPVLIVWIALPLCAAVVWFKPTW